MLGDSELIIPIMKIEGEPDKEYQLKDLTEEQFLIAYVILQKLREWYELSKIPTDIKVTFEPLRMTVMGQAGTGKTTLINTLVSTIRKLTKNNNSIHVATPTGSTAFAVQGQTIHRLFKVNPQNMDKKMTEEEKKFIHKNFEETAVIIFDERSLIGQPLFGKAETNTAECAHGYGHEYEDWGGIPIVINIGDDYQLPPVMTQGAFDCFSTQGNLQMNSQYNGRRQFIQFGKTVMVITKIMRQDENQTEFRPLLKNLRSGNTTDDDIEVMLSLHLSRFPGEVRDAIRENATYVFANRAPMLKHNLKKLKQQHSADNPVARILSKTTTWNGKIKQGKTSHFTQNDIPYISNICRGATVKISGRNFIPKWGLFNGSIGTVIEIVYDNDKGPLDGDLPEYVIVEIENYCGPSWMETKPKWIPIPVVSKLCDKQGCKRCTMEFIPLTLAYAWTIHGIQGMNVGFKHLIKKIIAEPGNRGFEGINPGTLYTVSSRATSIGNKRDRTTSELFFDGPEMNGDRIRQLTRSLTSVKGISKEYEKCIKRRKWTEYLESNIKKITPNEEEKSELLEWATKAQMNKEEIQKIIKRTGWRTTNNFNY